MANLIYQPRGKAKEYSPWACNLYNGCTNRCEYCYNRHGLAANLLGRDTPQLKSKASFEQFRKELDSLKGQILKDGKGLFFNFVSDPFLPETIELNIQCYLYAVKNNVPCVFLSKRMPPKLIVDDCFVKYKDLTKVGFTLTGCDDLEPEADYNSGRLIAMNYLVSRGVTTWASIEPVIDIEKSKDMIEEAYQAGCRIFKIGLLSGKRDYTPKEVADFMIFTNEKYGDYCEIYWKDSVFDYIAKETK